VPREVALSMYRQVEPYLTETTREFLNALRTSTGTGRNRS
jgi:hypothetical protein